MARMPEYLDITMKLHPHIGTLHIGSTVLPTWDRLAVLRNPGRTKPKQYAIVSYHQLHPHHGLVGYKQGFGEPYAGLYVYNFVHWFTAARVAHEIVASGRTIWAGEG